MAERTVMRATRRAACAALLATTTLAGSGLILPAAVQAGQDRQWRIGDSALEPGKLSAIRAFYDLTRGEAEAVAAAYTFKFPEGRFYALVRKQETNFAHPSLYKVTVYVDISLFLMFNLGDDPSLTLPGFPGSLANAEVQGNAMSADAAVVVGSANYGGATPTTFSYDHAFRWTAATGTIDIDGRDPFKTFSRANAVSGDGAVVVGLMGIDDKGGAHAFRWTEGTGMQDLGTVSGSGWSEALGISGDGRVIVGWSDFDLSLAGFLHAASWTEADGWRDLGALPARLGTRRSAALAASHDGATIVGWSVEDPTRFNRAVSWSGGTIRNLGVLSGDVYSYASAVSADGTVIVGTSSPDNPCTRLCGDSLTGNEHAFRWTDATGMRDLRTLLAQDDGLNMDGISLLTADGLSADGVAIVGQAQMPGASERTTYLVTYIDATNYQVAKDEGLIDRILEITSGGGGGTGGGTGGFTTTASVAASVNDIASRHLALFAQEKVFNTLLGSPFDPLLGGGNHLGFTTAAGSTTIGLHGRVGIGDEFTLLGGIGYSSRDYSNARIESPVTVAAALRWMPEVGGDVHPFFEIGGFVSPRQNARFERSYASGAGTATGVGHTHSSLAEGYVRGGIVLTPRRDMQLALSADIGRGRYRHDGYSEIASASNPFPATFAAGTDTATLVHAQANLNWLVEDNVSIGLLAGVGRSFGHPDVAGVVAGTPYLAADSDISWIDYGVNIGYRLDRNTSLDAFVIGQSGNKGTGSHFQGGINLRVTF